jgi:hypothetical protein
MLLLLLLQIKAANKAFLRHIANVNRAEDLMLQAGWRPKVRTSSEPVFVTGL